MDFFVFCSTILMLWCGSTPEVLTYSPLSSENDNYLGVDSSGYSIPDHSTSKPLLPRELSLPFINLKLLDAQSIRSNLPYGSHIMKIKPRTKLDIALKAALAKPVAKIMMSNLSVTDPDPQSVETMVSNVKQDGTTENIEYEHVYDYTTESMINTHLMPRIVPIPTQSLADMEPDLIRPNNSTSVVTESMEYDENVNSTIYSSANENNTELPIPPVLPNATESSVLVESNTIPPYFTKMIIKNTSSEMIKRIVFIKRPTASTATKKRSHQKRAVGDENHILVRPITPSPMPSSSMQSNVVQPPTLHFPLIKKLQEETSVERTERRKQNLEKLMQFMTICGHVDRYVNTRFKSGVKKLTRVFDTEEETDATRRRRYSTLI